MFIDHVEKLNTEDMSSQEGCKFVRANVSGKVNEEVEGSGMEEKELLESVDGATDSTPSCINNTKETPGDHSILKQSQVNPEDKFVCSHIPVIVEKMKDSGVPGRPLLSSHADISREIMNDSERVPRDVSLIGCYQQPEREGNIEGEDLEKSTKDTFVKETRSKLDEGTRRYATAGTSLSGIRSNSLMETHACSEKQRYSFLIS